MKNALVAGLAVSLSVGRLLTAAPCFAQANKPPAFAVELATLKGEKIAIADFYRDTYSTSSNFKVNDSKVPTVVHLSHRDLAVEHEKHLFFVPFEAIKTIAYSLRESSRERQLIAQVTLGDDTVLEGKTYWDTFPYKSDLGWTAVKAAEIASVSFKHKAAAGFRFKPNGKHGLVLHEKNGTTKSVSGATFHQDKLNVNSCIIGDSYPESFTFETDGKTVEVEWNNIRSLKLAANQKIGNTYAPWLLATKTGKEFQGACSAWFGMAKTIEGAFQLSANYTFKILVPIQYALFEQSFSMLEFR